MAEKVKWRVPGIFNADAQKVSDEIHSIGEQVKPADLVGYAKDNPDSELYKCFDWNDVSAAAKYRLSQAQKVIQSIVIVTEKPDVPPVREYSLTTQKTTYAPTRQFLVNQDEYEALLLRALTELRAFRQRYKTLSELESVFTAIDEL